MNARWGVETEARLSNSFERMLVEVYGCMPMSDRVIDIHAARQTARVVGEMHGDHTMEGMLVEVYGCMPMSDRVINLYTGRDRRAQRYVRPTEQTFSSKAI